MRIERTVHSLAALAAAIVVVGCYSPNFREGLPCSQTGACPNGQSCAADGRCYSDDSDLNDDSSLVSLEVSRGQLEPPFDPAVTSYRLVLGLGGADLAVTGTASAAGVTIAVNGTELASGEQSPLEALALGDSLTEVVVRAASGRETVYAISVSRGPGILKSAYVKASNTGTTDRFGACVALSADTLAVCAVREASSGIGVDAEQDDDSAAGAGAVYIFVRAGETWSQQAYIKPSNTELGDFFGFSIALDGDTLVVGATLEDSAAVGVNGFQGDNNAAGSGAVYVFARSGTTWSQQAYLKASNTDAGDAFGTSVSISGNTLAVGAQSEDSGAMGVGGDATDNSAPGTGAVYVFVRNGATWSQETYLKASNSESEDFFGRSVAVSNNTLAVGASRESSSAVGIGGSETDNNAPDSGAVYVFVRNGSVWTQEAYIKSSNTDAGDEFGKIVSLSGDTLAVSAPLEDSVAVGVAGNENDNSAIDSGAVYVFTRESGVWSQQAFIKASNTEAADLFGVSASLSGDSLAVGANEASTATSVGGSQSDNGAPDAGAVYLFVRNESTWSQQAYIKASNTNSGDRFGSPSFVAHSAVALLGATIVVGASDEDSGSSGVDGVENDNTSIDSGAVYIFE